MAEADFAVVTEVILGAVISLEALATLVPFEAVFVVLACTSGLAGLMSTIMALVTVGIFATSDFSARIITSGRSLLLAIGATLGMSISSDLITTSVITGLGFPSLAFTVDLGPALSASGMKVLLSEPGLVLQVPRHSVLPALPRSRLFILRQWSSTRRSSAFPTDWNSPRRLCLSNTSRSFMDSRHGARFLSVGR
jgi:hypothetical protein